MLLSSNQLYKLIRENVIDAPEDSVNPASIEVTLGNRFYIESHEPWIIDRETRAFDIFTDLANKSNISLKLVEIPEGKSMVLKPGQFCLAETQEVFNLPNNVVAEYVLKSSMARNGWGHLLAGYADPGWHNSKLTTEFKNETQDGFLILTPGQKCGQMKFYLVEEVPHEKSYAVVGQYNNQTEVTASKGIR